LRLSIALENNSDQFILGTRNFKSNDIPFKSKWGNLITSFVFLLTTRKRCIDTQTGLRGIPKSLFEICLLVSGTKYNYEMNVLMELAKKGVIFSNIPINTIYIDDNRSSHFKPIIDSLKIYLGILKYSISSLSSTLIDLLAFSLLINFVFTGMSAGILFSTIIARLVSGNANFFINKHWVFKSRKKDPKEALKYIVLFGLQMLTSGLLVTSLSIMPIPPTLIKAFVDTGLFFISYQIQKRFVFNIKSEGSVSFR